MGSSASKGARAAGSAARKYPTRVPTSTNQAPAAPKAQQSRPSPETPIPPPPAATATTSQTIDMDGRDPGLAARLSQIGAVQPNPHFSPSSTSNFDPRRSADVPSDMMQPPPASAFPSLRDNPALRVLEARQNIQEEADRELEQIGRRGFEGRKYLDAGSIQLALMRKKRGESDTRIEEAMGIKKGRLALLGKGFVESPNSAE